MAFKVTPWEVKGNIKYDRLIEQFGLSRITDNHIERIERIAGESHYMLRRGVFIAHRDLDWILDNYEKGKPFYLYTGRGPSGDIHIGHAMPWIFVKWLQDKFNAILYFQFTDDEKFLFKEGLDLAKVEEALYENMLDVAAFGFNPERTVFVSDIRDIELLYPHALKVSKKINYSTAKAVFGFKDDTNIGQLFFTSIQSVPSFLHSEITGTKMPCLIPHAVDQDPHFRVSRDVLPKLGHYKPASIQCVFLPGLEGEGKLSSSEGNIIGLHDDEKTIRKKINKYAYSGGRDTVEEHRAKGGRSEMDISYQYMRMMFEPDDKVLSRIEDDYRTGKLLSGEIKNMLIDRITKYNNAHKESRKKAEKNIKDYLITEEKIMHLKSITKK
ncbi:MAG: tryptophan--tRNA ligase [Candidatus Woesearchaeota archaeon]